MDIKRILKKFSVEESIIEDMKDEITKEIGTDFIPKTQYAKKINQIDLLQEKLDDLEAKEGKDDGYKQKFEDVTKEYEAFKNNIETTKVTDEKKTILKSFLAENGYTNGKIVDLLLKEVDLEKVNLEEGKLKDFDIKSIDDNYAEFKTKVNTGGTPPAGGGTTPPPTGDSDPLALALENYM
ncbi:MAG: hypothetical protein ACRDDY_02590 [Clostridium sp.]|uniref:hypothetical protein n=1 Tax=Clostridium sp. TaxID=1506 RepID=UPI003EE631B3